MKSFRLFPGDFVAGLLSLLFVLALAADVSDAQFFNSELAETSPRTRMGCYPCSTLGTDFLDVKELGQHTYKFGLSEKNGIVYTCRGGHIDTAHLRKAADWTAYIAAKTYEELKKGETGFSFRLMEPSLYHVEVTYPENWKDLSEQQRENIIFDTSIRLGEYFVYTATTWHEILTWFGYKCTGFLYSEFTSAFTWEDTFSNLLGTYVAAQALRDTEHEYDEAMTLALAGELQKLGVQSSQTAKRASKKVKGRWFSSNLMLFISMKKRHFDIGLKDGCVTPAIVPSVSGCEGAEPLPYPAPSLDFLSEYGFKVKLEIEPREMEKGKILRIVYLDGTEDKERIEPAIHFVVIMESIKEEAIKKYGSNVDLCEAKPWRLAKATESKERVKLVVPIVEVAGDITEETTEKIADDVELSDTPSFRYLVKVEEIESAESDVPVDEVEADVKEDVVEEISSEVEVSETPPRQLVKAVDSPIKIYDFGFKVSWIYLGSVSNKPKIAFCLVDDNVSGTDESRPSDGLGELTSKAYKWLETASE